MKSRSKYLVLTTDYLIPLIIILSALTTYLLSFHTPLFAIKAVICTLDYEPCQNQSVIAELDKSKGENLLTLNTLELETRLLSGEYTTRSVELSRSFPSTLRVDLLSTYPVIALQLSDNKDKWIALDSRNRVITVTNNDPNVPTVTLDSTPPFRLGEQVLDSNVVQVIELALEISSELSTVDTIHLGLDSTVTLELTSGVTALLTTTKDFLDQIYALQAILADSSILKEYKIVDVRFSRPVLK